MAKKGARLGVNEASTVSRPIIGHRACSTKQTTKKRVLAAVDRLFGIYINSSNRADYLLEEIKVTEPEFFWLVFHEVWNSCDDTAYLWPVLAHEFARVGPSIPYLTAEQQAFYDSLDDGVTVYRGCSHSRIAGPSWTNDFETAKGFAIGHRGIPVPNPVVQSYEIEIADILTVITDRGENEVILNPSQVALWLEVDRFVTSKAEAGR